MSRAASDSFILELPLATTVVDDCALGVRLNAARQIFNAVLGECLRILGLMRESRDWGRARAIPKGRERVELFKSVIARFDFKSSMADRFAIACKNGCWIGDHLSSNETQKMALRAFQGVQRHGLGKGGRPRFKRLGEIQSIEGKTNKTGIRFTGDGVEWSGLRLAILLAPHDPRQAALAFPAAKPPLRRAASSEDQPTSGSGFPVPTVARPSEWVVRRRKDKMSSRLRTAYRWTVSIREGRREQAKSGENLPTSFQNPTD